MRELVTIGLAAAMAGLLLAAPAEAQVCPGYYGMERVQATGISCHQAKQVVLGIARGERLVLAPATHWAWRCRWNGQVWPEATCRKAGPLVKAAVGESRRGVVRARMPRD